MQISEAKNQQQWDDFLGSQQFRPFLQSWTMGEVYRETGQTPIRLEVRENGDIAGICQAVVVPARRGKHLAISYGPVIRHSQFAILNDLKNKLQSIAKDYGCSFIRFSPFLPQQRTLHIPSAKPAPLHLLAEHIWYLPLRETDFWQSNGARNADAPPRDADAIMKDMRKNHRNLIRRAGREGVTVEASDDPVRDLPLFIELHEETRKRHKFTPYTNQFFEAQVRYFSIRNECTLYLARYNDEVVAASIHMHAFGETSYHHGASTNKYPKLPASYLLQWTAIQDALQRGDHVYSFWGIAPEGIRNHPFAGVTTFKRGFGGQLLELHHCRDIPVRPQYYATRAFEYLRKWRRGF